MKKTILNIIFIIYAVIAVFVTVCLLSYNQFKVTQAQWDSSTKSTEKLRAQQEYLKNAYEIQQDKVKVLSMQLADLENAENKNTTAIIYR